MILGGDLGGTKTLLALAEQVDGRIAIVREQRFASIDYPDFDLLLAEFLAGCAPLEAAAFGIAGPTDGLTGKLTYLPWRLGAAALEARFGIRRVVLANDFAAAAHGLEQLAPQQLFGLQAGEPQTGGPRLVLGAGTGLGVAGLIAVDGRYRVIPGEGGHIGFSPQSPQQMALWQTLFKRNGRVTSEDVLCGAGLARIHAFLGGAECAPDEVGRAALAGDRLAGAAYALWSSILGGFAGDLALHWLARGGVYLAGGIAAKLMPALGAQDFIAAFNAKREHRALVERMPVHLVTEERLGLLGALAMAADQAG
ncbi:MAG: glucokinase [Zoogloea sp.]|nr:glucokinase [Zoogloea sp.]